MRHKICDNNHILKQAVDKPVDNPSGPIVEISTNLDHLKNPFSFMSRINSLTKRKQIETKPI